MSEAVATTSAASRDALSGSGRYLRCSCMSVLGTFRRCVEANRRTPTRRALADKYSVTVQGADGTPRSLLPTAGILAVVVLMRAVGAISRPCSSRPPHASRDAQRTRGKGHTHGAPSWISTPRWRWSRSHTSSGSTGYNATSVPRLTERLSIGSGSLYAAFGSRGRSLRAGARPLLRRPRGPSHGAFRLTADIRVTVRDLLLALASADLAAPEQSCLAGRRGDRAYRPPRHGRAGEIGHGRDGIGARPRAGTGSAARRTARRPQPGGAGPLPHHVRPGTARHGQRGGGPVLPGGRCVA